MDKIFVQVASYRDPQMIPTVEDMIAKADNPEALTFGIVWQYDSSEPIDYFDGRENFTVDKYHYYESEGLGWARNKTNKLYNGEKYTLQIDSHHRFVKGWDTMLLEDYNQALLFSPKPIITTYCTPFDPTSDEYTWNPVPCLMSQYEFSADKLLMSMPYYIQKYKDMDRVIKARTISGHFYFVEGTFINEVPYDPRIYFGGYTEETSLSARAFTAGYDFYSPYRMIMWHEYTRNYRVKHWDDHGHKNDNVKVTSGERDILARNLTRQLFGQEDHGILFGEYGLGDHRTLHDYEVYGGFDFKQCKIQEYTLQVQEPPNPLPWHEQFKIEESMKYSMSVSWDVDHFKSQFEGRYKAITLGVIDRQGNNLYRKDFTSEDPQVMNYLTNSHYCKFSSTNKPEKLVMYGLTDDDQWTTRFEAQL